VREVPAAAPGPGQLLLHVEACGVCGTDLHILAGESYRPELPFVLGHEPVGVVRAVGDGVDAGSLGRRVTMTLFEGCGACAWCLRGDERLCERLVGVYGVLSAWGGFAEQMVVSAARVVPVPTGLSTLEAAALVDAGATAANAAEAVRRHEAETVLVIGGGPVGLLVAELVSRSGATVTVVEPLAPRRELLEALGHAVEPAIGQVRGSFEAVADCAGAATAVPDALERVAASGVYLVVGYTTLPEFELAIVARRELRIQGIRSGSRTHLEEVLRLAAGRAIRVPPVTTWPLDRINDAFAALRSGSVAGKAVIEITPQQEERWTS
jgi:2-desacetyl-2-hydroxyethyl bacteriochlorophyllide A dehydrogenase